MSSVREFIISASEHFFALTTVSINEFSEDTLNDFIYNSPTLLQTYLANNNQLHFDTKINGNARRSIIFYKSVPQDLLSEDALNQLNMLSLGTSPPESLYQVLKQVYAPLLASDDSVYSNKLHKNLMDLESNLRVLAHGKTGDNSSVILTIDDEVDYWKTRSQRKDAHKKEREAASAFCVLFEDICKEISSMASLPIQEIRDSAENIGGILDDIWRCTSIPFEQERMVHIFDIIGHALCTVLQKAVSKTYVWKIYNGPKDNEILALLSESFNVVQTWISACTSLTETYWPNYALHTWNNNLYVPLFCLNFKNRLQEIYDIKSTYNQLSKLLTKSEKEELKTDDLFEAFENINIWLYNGPNQLWNNAVSEFSVNLRPAEIKIAEKLKPRMRNASTKQILYEFMRYKSLINRTHVKQALHDELEIFVSCLLSFLKEIHGQLDIDDVDVKMHQPPEMSFIIQQVQWAKQTESKVKDIQMCTENYLNDFEGSAQVRKLSTQLLKDLKVMYTQLHEEWSRDLQAQVKSGSLAVCVEKPVVQFSSGRLLQVNFSARAVRAELEARALSAAGMRSPPAAHALRPLAALLPHARALHQVASFHNTLGERMIPSTRPMMLQSALDLSALVEDQKPVYWNDEQELAKYTDKLKDIVLKLESQNTYLTSQHIVIRNIVEKLLDTELLAKQSEWKKKIKDIRDIIEKVENNGYKNTDMWRAHWDIQLYRALECQYIKALLSLHIHFPQVKVDLVLRGQSVRLQPPLEELRVQHYHQLRRLVALPAHFVGLRTSLTHNKSIFASIVDKHSWMGNKAVRRVEAALAQAECVRAQWARRAALAAAPDLPALCARHLRDPHHWEDNFRACKAYGQAVAKMSFEEEKVEWITVSPAALRREMETAARQLWAALAGSLHAACRADAAALHAAAALLTPASTPHTPHKPTSLADLADLAAKQQALRDNFPQMELIVESLKKKGHMLRTWGGDPFVDDTIKEWQKMREQMKSQEQMFEHQTETVKCQLSGEWEKLNNNVESWVSRWRSARARLMGAGGASGAGGAGEMRARCGELGAALSHLRACVADRDRMLTECVKINMKLEVSEIWKEAEDLKLEYETLWMKLNDYIEDFDLIAEQEWIVFQKKLHLLDEFVVKWNSQLEPFTVITLFIKQELEKYSDLTAALKYVRGTDFTERHWREVFSLLDMEQKHFETLQLKDFLAVSANLKKHTKELQKMSSAASHEATIRIALNELELWYAGARLALIYHNDKAKRVTPIVKDFKEILTKVEEQQWAAAALGEAGAGAGAGSGAGAGAGWDARLRAARRLLRAAHHAQRRYADFDLVVLITSNKNNYR